LSNIVVQLYEHAFGSSFNFIDSTTGILHAKAYAILHPQEFLTVLNSTPRIQTNGGLDRDGVLTLMPNDMNTCMELTDGRAQLEVAMVLYGKRDKESPLDDDME